MNKRAVRLVSLMLLMTCALLPAIARTKSPVQQSSSPSLASSATDTQADEATTLMVRANTDRIRVGESLVVAILVDGKAEFSHAKLAFQYNPAVLSCSGVRDGGLFRFGLKGHLPELDSQAVENLLLTTISRPVGTSDAPGNGQLLLFIFKGLAAGNSDLGLDLKKTFLSSASGSVLPIKFKNMSTEVAVVD